MKLIVLPDLVCLVSRMRRSLTLAAMLVFGLAAPTTADAQDEESSPTIELGSRRIGGPGLTKRERKITEQWDAPEEYVTEETLPKKGSKKRMPALFVLLLRYHDGQAWKDACEKLDMIIEEGGDAAIEGHPRGKRMASKSYFECAKMNFVTSEYEKTEKLLKLSEKWGGTTPRHAILREKMVREGYRKKMTSGDISGAVAMFNQAQKMNENEDERIWLGERLADMAWHAFEAGDEPQMKDLMMHLEDVAPQNTKYRRLKEKLEAGDSVLADAAKLAFLVIGFVVAWGAFSKWRAKAKVKTLVGSDLEEF